MRNRLWNLLYRAVAFIPLKRRLAARVAIMQWHGCYEPEWYKVATLGPNRGTALDIGANRGYWSFVLARHYDAVIAFEPNVSITAELSALSHPQIQIRSEALSDSEADTTLYIPRSPQGRLLDGWASLYKDHLTERSGEVELAIRTTSLDALNLQNVTFVKIDVEGHEQSVLRGAQDFLRRNRPTVLVEVRESTYAEVTKLLVDAGLSEAIYTRQVAEEKFYPMRLFVPD